MKLKNVNLLRNQSFINSNWIEASDGKVFPVYNPANGDIVSQVADCGVKETEEAINSAHVAFKTWSKRTAKERATLMKKWFDLIVYNADDLALLMTTEQGKPLEEAKGEVIYGASFIEWFAEEARRTYGDVIPTPSNNKRLLTIKQPVGVVAAITPWNFPLAMITRKIAPAIAAGCTVVLKPAALTPLTALALAELAHQAGIPSAVINIITTTNAAEVGKLLTQHPLISKFSFTGSTGTGRLLMQQCASTIKKVSLELGGNAPLIVFDDADISLAVKGALASKYRNAGQTCVCANRILVQAGIYKSFTEEYTKAVKALKVGDGTEPGVNIGPLINEDAVKKVKHLLKDAVQEGATINVGGKTHNKGQLFFEPTIVENCTTKMALSEEEIFGPVSAIYKFETEEEAIEIANNTQYGLAAYFFSKDINRVWRVAEQLDYGMIGINEGIISHAEAPFGGVKQSGIGREGSRYGIDEYLEIKYLCLGGM